MTDPAACGPAAVIVDDHGGYLPLGLAEHLTLAGCHVTIVTSAEAVGSGLGTFGTTDFGWIYPRIRKAGVEVITSAYVDHIGSDHVSLLDVQTSGVTRLASNSVVPVMMRYSDDALYHELAESGVNVHRLGDCVAPREIDDAVFEGTREGHAVEMRTSPRGLAAV